VDADPDPSIFVIGLQDVNKNCFFAYYFFKVHSNHFSKIKSHEEVKKQESRFFLLFLLEDRRIRTFDFWFRIQEAKTYGSGSATLLFRAS
jgi:hypothetical protein